MQSAKGRNKNRVRLSPPSRAATPTPRRPRPPLACERMHVPSQLCVTVVGARDPKKYRILLKGGQRGARGGEMGWRVWRSVGRGDTQRRTASHQARSKG